MSVTVPPARTLARALVLAVLLAGVLASPVLAAPFTRVGQVPTGPDPTAVGHGDFDDDGDEDLAVVGYRQSDTEGHIATVLGDGDGTFGAATTRSLTGRPMDVDVADLDGDDDEDLAVADQLTGNVSVLRGSTGGTFLPAVNLAAGSTPAGVAIADVDADGHRDIVVANAGDFANPATENVAVLYGDGTGAFPTRITYPAGPKPYKLVARDLDGDDALDLAVVGIGTPGTLSILAGDGDRGFAAPATTTLPGPGQAIAAGDFNDDEDVDLAVTSRGANTLSIFLGQAGLALSTPVEHATATLPWDVVAGDFGGDGDEDLAVAAPPGILLFAGGTGGTFGAATAVTPDIDSLGLTLAELNGDGDLDLAAADGTVDGAAIATGGRPAAPTGLAVAGAARANDTIAEITGTAEAGTTVALYTNSACTGSPVATGSAEDFAAAPGLSVTVSDDSTTTLWATATDVGGTSDCSTSSATYVEDSTGPDAPTGLAMDPAGPANENDPVVTLTASSDTVGVELYTSNTCAGTPVAAGSGDALTGGIGVTVGDNSTTTFYARAYDAANNASACSTSSATYVEDSTPPAVPSGLTFDPASPANDTTPSISGSADPGTTVTVFRGESCNLSEGTVTAGQDGRFSLGVTVTANTTTPFTATAADAAGNPSACSASAAYVEDSTAPAAPSDLGVDPASPANDTTPHVTATAEPGSIVAVYTVADCSTAPVATGTAGDGGEVDIEVTVADDSISSFRLTATDAAGNPSPCSDTFVRYREDSTANAPTNLAVTPAGPANDNTPVVTGEASDASDFTVKLYASADCTGDPVATGPAFGSGFEVTVQDNTTTTFSATITDEAQNTSSCSSPVSYTEDSATTAPAGLTFTPASPGSDATPQLSGTAEPGATISVYRDAATCTGTAHRTTTANGSGAFSVEVAAAENTSTSFSVKATDTADNEACTATPATYVHDSQPPAAPSNVSVTSGPANDNTPTVTGTTDASTIVRIYATADCTGQAAASGTSNGTGSFSIDVPVADDSQSTFRAVAVDPVGNRTACPQSGVHFQEDSTATAPANVRFADPGSPANQNRPAILLDATDASAFYVLLYAEPDCQGDVIGYIPGEAVAEGQSAELAPGFFVPDDETTTFTARLTDAAQNDSACSAGAAYVEDSTAPAAPAGLSVTPAGPANDNAPRVKGTAEAGSTVRVYATAACTGSPLATGTAATFGGAGIQVAVADDSTTTFRVVATDAAGNRSPCSAGVTYREVTPDAPAPGPGPGGGTDGPSGGGLPDGTPGGNQPGGDEPGVVQTVKQALSKITTSRKGTATLAFRFASAGTLTVEGTASLPGSAARAAKRVRVLRVKRAVKPGTVRVKVKPGKRARKVLGRRGTLKVRLRVRFAPKGGKATTLRRTVRFKVRRKA